MRAFRAVLFDLDGTLLDTLEDLADSLNCVLSTLGLPQHPVAAYKTFVGDGVENLVIRAAPQTERDQELRQRLVSGMRSEYGKRWACKTRPYPGIVELLDNLASRQLKMAVLSNKPQEFTELCVNQFLSGWRFSEVRGLDTHTPRKPDPTAALAIAQRLGVEPTNFVYLGDTDTDMRTATAALMYPVGVLWGFREADELLANGAQTLLNHPLDLLRCLDPGSQ